MPNFHAEGQEVQTLTKYVQIDVLYSLSKDMKNHTQATASDIISFLLLSEQQSGRSI